MTPLVEWWDDACGTRHIRINGCLATSVSDREARDAHDEFAYGVLVTRRVAPLVWLAMPGHEDSPMA